jgi:hypothetical protein
MDHCFGEPLSTPRLSKSWSHSSTPKAWLQTPTSNWQRAFFNSTSPHKPSTCASAPSQAARITRRLSRGRRPKSPPPLATSAPAYLLRLHALHQRFHRYYASAFFVPGTLNAMADDCSRLWHLTDAQLLTHFNSTYPQTAYWRLVHPRPELLSSVTSALRRKRPELALFLREPPPMIAPGSSGPVSATISLSTLGSEMTALMPSFSYKSLPSATEQAILPPVAGLSSLGQWRAPYAPWVRPL